MSGWFNSFEAWCIYTVLFLGAISYMLNQLRKFVRGCWRFGNAVAARIHQFNREWDIANAIIQYQLQHNNGHSLLDMASRIDSNNADSLGHWTGLEAGQVALSADIAAIKAQMQGFGDTQIEIVEAQERGRILLEAAFSVAPEEQRRVVADAAAKLPPPKRRA